MIPIVIGNHQTLKIYFNCGTCYWYPVNIDGTSGPL